MVERLPINYLDTGRVARDKINDSFNELNSNFDQLVVTVQWYRPHIENWYWWIWNTNTWVWAEWVKVKEWDNLIKEWINQEIYADLQFENWLTPTSAFPTWVVVWNVDSSDWWTQSGVMLNSKTTDWDYVRRLYGDDWKLYFDWGLGTFKVIATTDDLDSALGTLRSELATVAFTGKSSDLDNDAGFNSVPVMTMEQYEETPWTAWDDKRYFIYDSE